MASGIRHSETIGTESPADDPTPDYVERNRAAWDRWAPAHLGAARKAWKDPDLRWGVWGLPESRLGLLRALEPNDDVIELGCGTAEISAWLAQQGAARPVGIDVSMKQVQNVENLQRDFGIRFPVIRANAEDIGYEDASFDMAISEYGASLWCDPRRWLPEAHRLLRPKGRLVFVTNSALLWVCTSESGGMAQDRLVRDYFGRSRIDFVEGPVEFHLTHGDWIRTLRQTGFVIEDLIEVRPPAGARPRFSFVSLEWARRWPSEDIWIARKTA